jgi:hypothetical protein
VSRADARRQLDEITATRRAQGQAAAASHLQRRLRLARKGRLAARYRENLKPAGALARAAEAGGAPVTARRMRELIEALLDETGWPWCQRWSLLLDKLLIREERGA